LDIWDYLILAGVGLLVFFTPFAFGGVDVWALDVAEGICFVMALLWLLKCYLSPRGRGGFPLAHRDFRVLALAVGAFLALLLIQILPMPPAAIHLLSPQTYRLYQQSIPGWPNRIVYEDPGYLKPPGARKPSQAVVILPTVDEVKGGAVIPFAPPSGDAVHDQPGHALSVGSWRSISIMPILTRAGLVKCAAYAALFFLVVFYRPGRGDAAAEHNFRRNLVLIVLASGAAVALAGLSQQAPWFENLLWFYLPSGSASGFRASGPFANPDHFANYLAMVLPIALAGALFRVPLEPRPGLSGFQLLCTALALAIATAIMLSLSRAGWIEIGLGILAFAWMLRVRLRHARREAEAETRSAHSIPAINRLGSWFLPLGFGLIVIALAALVILGPGGREEANSRVAESVTGGVGFWDRIHVWQDSSGILRDYPVFGSGFDTWPAAFTRYVRPPWDSYFNGAAQNDYVEVIAECGILGLVLLVWIGWRIGRTLYKDSFFIPSRHWPLFAALIPAIAIMGFHETLDFCLQIPANAIMFVIIVAMAMRLARTYGGAPMGPPPGVLTRRAVPALFAMTAIAGLVAVHYQQETLYPDDLPLPATLADVEAIIQSHPGSALPHLWLADRIHNRTGVWLTKELTAAVWLDPTNPASRDPYAQALLDQGRRDEALRAISTAAYDAPDLNFHDFLSPRLVPWMSPPERGAVEKGLLEAAADDYEGATQSLADLYQSEGRELQAAAAFEQAAAREPDPSLKYGYYLAAGQGYAEKGKTQHAERLFLAAVDAVPDDPRAYADLVTLIYGPEKNSSAADRIIQTALDNGVSPTPLYLSMSEAAETAGDYKAAETALKQAVRYEPSYSNWMRLGGFYLRQEKFYLAAGALHHAVEIKPNSGDAYFGLAQAEEGIYQYPQARADYERAIALSPDNREFKARSLDLAHKIDEDSANNTR
jgi:tetratricopeptide (TPR) repeat protein